MAYFILKEDGDKLLQENNDKLILDENVSVDLNSPTDASSASDTTPTLDFTGTDATAQSLEYEVQIDPANTFDSNNVLSDTFGGGSLDGAKWSNTSYSGGTAVVSSGYLACSPVALSGNTSGNVTSLTTYDLTARYTKVNVTQTLVQNGATYFYIVKDGSNKIFFRVYQGNIAVFKVVAGLETQLATMAYNSTTHAHWRMREQEGTVYFDYSSNNSTWINFTFLATPFVITSVSVVMEGYDFSADAAPGSARFVNFKFGNAQLVKLSVSDTGFVNPDTGGDTHPFNSGENIQYTVQAGDALSTTTYYWRVRAIDPSGSNVYSDWSSIYSFTITAPGASNVKVFNGLAQASIKTVNGLAIASIKTINGLTNV